MKIGQHQENSLVEMLQNKEAIMRVFIILILCMISNLLSDGVSDTKETKPSTKEEIDSLCIRYFEMERKGKTIHEIIGNLYGHLAYGDTTTGLAEAIKKSGEENYQRFLKELRLRTRISAMGIIYYSEELSESEKLNLFIDALCKECVSPVDTARIGGVWADYTVKNLLIGEIFHSFRDKIYGIFAQKRIEAKSKILIKYLNCLIAKCGDNQYNAEMKKYVLKEKDPLIRRLAIEGLGETNDTSAIEILKKVLHDTTCYYTEIWLMSDTQIPFPGNRNYFLRDATIESLKKLGVDVKRRLSPEGFWEPYIEEEEKK